MADLRMPFGKYKGEKIEDLPTEYIEWALENMEKPPHAEEMQNQIDLRAGRGVARGRREE
jgi:uncharacterized protein (DUF3820 family)